MMASGHRIGLVGAWYAIGAILIVVGLADDIARGMIAFLGDKVAHAGGAFALLWPALWVARGDGHRDRLLIALPATFAFSVILESGPLEVSKVFDAGDILANAVGGLAAALSLTFRIPVPDPKAARLLQRIMRRVVPACVVLLIVAVALLHPVLGEARSAIVPRGTEYLYPADGYLAVPAGQGVRWNWTGGYVDWWIEERTWGIIDGGDTSAAAGCFRAASDAMVRFGWRHTAWPSAEGPIRVDLVVDVIESPGNCPSISAAGARSRTYDLADFALCWSFGVSTMIIVAVLYFSARAEFHVRKVREGGLGRHGGTP